MFGGLVWYNASLCIFSLYGFCGKTCFTVKCLNVELSAFNISENVVLSTSSPRSNRDALAALFVLTVTILKHPLDNVTACLKSAYCAEDTFLELSSFSSLETRDVFSVASAWMAARKSNGESGRLSEDLDECEDLEHDELSEPSKL